MDIRTTLRAGSSALPGPDGQSRAAIVDPEWCWKVPRPVAIRMVRMPLQQGYFQPMTEALTGSHRCDDSVLLARPTGVRRAALDSLCHALQRHL